MQCDPNGKLKGFCGFPVDGRADAFDWELVKKTLLQLKGGKKVDVPTYDFKTHKRTAITKTIYGADVILFEGILSFHEKVMISGCGSPSRQWPTPHSS